jgi:hypothetical protein
MLDRLREKPKLYRYLDAAQLVKHALGLATQSRRQNKRAVLVYLFAEPHALDGRPISPTHHDAHRDEIADFSDTVGDSEVEFHAASYGEWLETWPADCAEHALAVQGRYLSRD